MSRLYGRNRLVQTLVAKQQFEDYLSSNFDKSHWYAIDSSLFSSASSSDLLSRFVRLDADQETDAFLEYCRDVSDSFCLQLFYDLASAVLGWIYTKTCINGILGRGIMFIFSTAHLSRILFDHDPISMMAITNSTTDQQQQWFRGGAVLDLGAGDGNISEKFRPFFDQIYATEASTVMQRRLAERGIKVIGIDDWWRTDDSSTNTNREQESLPKFRLISCLNLLDRHTKPLTLLRQLREKALADESLVLLAVVLPWSQYVEYQIKDETTGRTITSNRPLEPIALEGDTFEAQLTQLVERVLEPNGFRVIRWTRLPYLCEGDMNRSLYWLHDAVLLLRPVGE